MERGGRGKRWDDSRFPRAVRSKGYIPPRFEANFSICLEKSRPGLMPLINIRDKPTQPAGLSPFPTGNTCKPHASLPTPSSIPEGVATLATLFELDFTWNELPCLRVMGWWVWREGSGRKRLIEEKFRFRGGEGSGGETTRARSIRNPITKGDGGRECSLIVVELQIRYRDKEERARLFIFARGCNLRRILMTGRRWYVTPRLFYYRWFGRWFIYRRLIMGRNL